MSFVHLILAAPTIKLQTTKYHFTQSLLHCCSDGAEQANLATDPARSFLFVALAYSTQIRNLLAGGLGTAVYKRWKLGDEYFTHCIDSTCGKFAYVPSIRITRYSTVLTVQHHRNT